MREEVKVVKLDNPQQGMAIEALLDFRNKRIADGKCIKDANELIEDILDAPVKRRKVKERRDAR
jgi:hypothetical protein